jgi:hypothetical protein
MFNMPASGGKAYCNLAVGYRDKSILQPFSNSKPANKFSGILLLVRRQEWQI